MVQIHGIGFPLDINNGILLQFLQRSGNVASSNYLATINLPLSYSNNTYTIQTTLLNGYTPASYTQNVYSIAGDRPTLSSFKAVFSKGTTTYSIMILTIGY